MNYEHRERCVFSTFSVIDSYSVGNIPYEATEIQLKEILESFGPIVNIEYSWAFVGNNQY